MLRALRCISICFLSCMVCFVVIAHSATAATSPFPHNSRYPYGILPANINSSEVQGIYETWLNSYYEESGNLARIKFDNASETVSEGIGYGMLIMVYMDNAANSTQSKFDKLWNYYNNFLNENDLMHWKINGFSSVRGFNAATDAEVDVAVALLMAYKQWGNSSYLDAARELIAKIRTHEVNANRYLKPGDVWDDKKNPSYFSFVAFKLFALVDTDYTTFWNEVITNSYNLLNSAKNTTTGLLPDWCSEAGDSLGTGFSYDAARVPWRIGWAYAWYGDSEAYEIANDISSWINGAVSGDPSQIKDGYNLDGTVSGGWNNATFVGGFTVSAMVGSQHQTWLNASYNQLMSFSGQLSYFNKSLQVLYALLASGNMPNLWSDTSTDVDLEYLITGLKILAGNSTEHFEYNDCNGDSRWGLEETIVTLQLLSEQ